MVLEQAAFSIDFCRQKEIWLDAERTVDMCTDHAEQRLPSAEIRAIRVPKRGSPMAKDAVPSTGSMNQRCSAFLAAL